MFKQRYLHNEIKKDLSKKMVFVGGPRQVGKTTIAKMIGEMEYPEYLYLNWDNSGHRKKILGAIYEPDAKLVIYDEIHKYSRWKNFIKGEFDVNKKIFDILVTGSARLNLYKKGGDSLMGRYHYYRLHPFSVAELSMDKTKKFNIGKELKFQSENKKMDNIFRRLLEFGGYPEPYLEKNQTTLRRFHNERVDRLIKDDIRELESLRDLSVMQVLAEIIPTKVGSLFSLNSLREDLSVAHKTIVFWMNILENFYYIYRIYPFMSTKIRSLRKEPKMYMWDWSEVADESARFENIVASALLKFTHYLKDVSGYKIDLHFLRDLDGREVDFLLVNNGKPWLAVEVKRSDTEISKNLKYFRTKLNIPYTYQVVADANVDFIKDGIRVMSASKFMSGLV